MKQIKVLQVLPSLDLGGAQMMITSFYEKMNKNHIHCDFVVDHKEYKGLENKMKELGSTVYFFPTFTGLNYFEVKKAWEDFFKEHQDYQILHSHSRSYASLFFPIAKRKGLKTIIHCHSTSNGSGIKALIKNIIQYPLRYLADYCFACSNEAGLFLYGKKITKEPKYYVINNAIDLNKFKYNEEIRKKYRNDFGLNTEKVSIIVGALEESKNILFALEVFKKNKDLNPHDKLYIVGDGKQRLLIENKIKEYALDNNVFMLGLRDDVNNLLSMSDYFLMPSYWEGLSLAAIEAQCSGIKCLLNINVDHEVDLSNKCIFLELEVDKWLEEINKEVTRDDNILKIKEAKYDIDKEAKWLENFYEKIVTDE